MSTSEAPRTLPRQIAAATDQMAEWLRALPGWPSHPINATGTVSAHFGPTILSEHDCVLHFARFLAQAGVPWEDIHLELSPGQWMYDKSGGTAPKRIDLAIIPRDKLGGAALPSRAGGFPLEAVFEFALASNYWQFGTGSARATLSKVDQDVAKVAEYLRTGLATRGYVVIVEECDHGFAADYVEAQTAAAVEVLLLQRWRTG
jgi:hypothetical protein